MLTVRELVGDLELPLLAGDAGLDLPVRWVHMSELLDPTPWLSGGEVLLTTGMQLGACSNNGSSSAGSSTAAGRARLRDRPGLRDGPAGAPGGRRRA